MSCVVLSGTIFNGKKKPNSPQILAAHGRRATNQRRTVIPCRGSEPISRHSARTNPFALAALLHLRAPRGWKRPRRRHELHILTVGVGTAQCRARCPCCGLQRGHPQLSPSERQCRHSELAPSGFTNTPIMYAFFAVCAAGACGSPIRAALSRSGAARSAPLVVVGRVDPAAAAAVGRFLRRGQPHSATVQSRLLRWTSLHTSFRDLRSRKGPGTPAAERTSRKAATAVADLRHGLLAAHITPARHLALAAARCE